MKNKEIAILLLHAYTGNENDVKNLKNFLEKNDFSAFSLTLKGHNKKSLKDILEVDPNDWFYQVKEEIENLKQSGYKKIIVMGLSLGGILATKAAEELDIYAVGVFCSPVIMIEENFNHLIPNMIKYEEYNIKKYNIDSTTKTLIPLMSNQLNSMKKFFGDIESKLNYIKIPFYIAQGLKDELFNPECSKLLYNILKGTTYVDYNEFKDSGHVITVDKERIQFEHSVLNFLNSVIS